MITPDRPVSTSEVAGHYDDLDRFYREIWGEHVHHGYWITGSESPREATEQLVDHVASHLELGEQHHVLDIGCGYGATARKLARDHDVSVVGITISESQHRYACQQAAEDPRLQVLLRNCLENGFDPGSFDRVLSIECISHVADKEQVFNEINRVLKPGGRAVVIAWLAGESPTKREIRYLLEPICREGRLPGMASESEYRKMIASNSLQLESFADLTNQVDKTWKICLRRMSWALLVRPSYWWFLVSRASQHSVFLFSLRRIIRAYRCGAMRYGMFVVTKAKREES